MSNTADIIFEPGMKIGYRRGRDQPWVNATVTDIDRTRNHLDAEVDRSVDMWPYITLNMADPDFWDQIGTPF